MCNFITNYTQEFLMDKTKTPSLDWRFLMKKWHPIGDSNPCYRRERAVLVKNRNGVYNILQVTIRQMGVFLGGFNITMPKKLHHMI